jgi:hypothetical protein
MVAAVGIKLCIRIIGIIKLIFDNDFLSSQIAAFSHLNMPVRTEHDVQLTNTVSTCTIS